MLESETIESFPPGNPFHHDAIRMGVRIGSNVIAMFHQHVNERQATVIIVNTETGERMLLKFGEE